MADDGPWNSFGIVLNVQTNSFKHWNEKSGEDENVAGPLQKQVSY